MLIIGTFNIGIYLWKKTGDAMAIKLYPTKVEKFFALKLYLIPILFFYFFFNLGIYTYFIFSSKDIEKNKLF